MHIITNPAMWAALSGLLAAIGLEMVPAIQIGDHIIAAVAALAGLIGIIESLRRPRQAPEPVATKA